MGVRRPGSGATAGAAAMPMFGDDWDGPDEPIRVEEGDEGSSPASAPTMDGQGRAEPGRVPDRRPDRPGPRRPDDAGLRGHSSSSATARRSSAG